MQTQASVARQTRFYNVQARYQMGPLFVCPHLDLVDIAYHENYRLARTCTVCFTRVSYYTGDDPDIEINVSRDLGILNKPVDTIWRVTACPSGHRELRLWYKYKYNGEKINNEPFEPTSEAFARWYGSDGAVDRFTWRFEAKRKVTGLNYELLDDKNPKDLWIE
ncbi:uncharacterized protein KD926_011374 [Aspergillus affinis]|uniref:uncharacterized protein n=1 Tax=Aspergillus affinis TaxID=1070780 RepID=UPI0022FED4AE|nr:uncharacterized protein KD926_011374 [Aspergillus affinis]KAI9038036.1 hypothetical protein KD926_011374 [Aspergillus affinis]